MPGAPAGQQVDALQRRVGHAEVVHGVGVVLAPLELALEGSGISDLHSSVIRLILRTLVTGMIPGMIGTVTPASRARATKSK